jgi:hypothetical protein
MRDLLPAYAAGSLDARERDRVRAHLGDCPACRAELAAWRALADAARPAGVAPEPARMVRAVLTRSAAEVSVDRDRHPIRRLAALVVAEARLIRPAVPLASLFVMALGVLVVLTRAVAGPDPVLSLIAPILAAAGVAGTHRSRPEVVTAAPASGRLLLLVRLALVFGLDLALAMTASALLAGAATGLDALVAGWLGPMALLSSISLLVAVRFGPDVALGSAVALWAVRVLADGVPPHEGRIARLVVAVWSTNATVLLVSVAVAATAIFIAGRGEPGRGWRATQPM